MSTENTDLLPLKFLDELRAFGFTPEEEERLRKSLTFKTFKKGYILDSRAGILSTRHYIVKGTARIYYIENGKERNYGFSFDNQFIVIPYSIMMRDRDIFIQFLEDTKVCCVPSHEDRKNYPLLSSVKFWQFINIALIHHVSKMEEYVLMLRMDARDRYRWLIERHPHILETVSITQLASYLNVTKETLYRIRSGKY